MKNCTSLLVLFINPLQSKTDIEQQSDSPTIKSMNTAEYMRQFIVYLSPDCITCQRCLITTVEASLQKNACLSSSISFIGMFYSLMSGSESAPRIKCRSCYSPDDNDSYLPQRLCDTSQMLLLRCNKTRVFASNPNKCHIIIKICSLISENENGVAKTNHSTKS